MVDTDDGGRSAGARASDARRDGDAILEQTLTDAADTARVGARLAPLVHGGMLLTLSGELGAGKTTLVRGLLHGRGISGPIKSPSYALVEVYECLSLYFYHFDFYRVKNPIELEELGLREYFRPDSVCLVEWPERAGGILPVADLALELAYDGDGRRLRLLAQTPAGIECLVRYAEQGRAA